MAIEVGCFRPGDAEACEAIAAEVFAGINLPYFLEERHQIPGYGRQMNVFWTHNLFCDHPEHFLVVRKEGNTVGFAGLTVQQELGIGCMVHIGVHRSAQNQGVGHRLMEASLAHFRRLELPVAWVDYDWQNSRAGHLYCKFGFLEFGSQVIFDRPVDPSRDSGGPAVRAERSVAQLADRLPSDEVFFAQEELARIYGLHLAPREIRVYCLRDYLQQGLTAYLPTTDEDNAFVIAGREAKGPVLRLAPVGGAELALSADLIHGVLCQCSSPCKAVEPVVTAYAETFNPSDDLVSALQSEGFRQIHRLVYLSRRV
jgi:GNAT superfamily N-acetyltransferase